MLNDGFTRVIFFVPQYPYPVVGGLEKQAHELAKALLSNGVEIQVLSGQIANSGLGEEIVEGLLVTRIHWSKFRWVRYLRTPLDITRFLWTRRREFEVLHLHQFSPVSLYAILLAKILGKPVMTKLPNVADHGLPGLIARRLGWLRLPILLLSDAIVAMSDQSFQELRAVNFRASRILRVANGINLSRIPVRVWCDQSPRAICRIVFVGRLSEEKQIETLLKACRILLQSSDRPFTLDIWGDGPLASLHTVQAGRMGLADVVHFEGLVMDVTARLHMMDIFVLPSSREGNSNAILEAMAAGLPIVATTVGGTSMQVGDEGAPFLCPPGNPQALAVALQRLIEDPVMRHATGAAMRQRAEKYFDISAIADIYAHAYRCLARGRADDICNIGHPLLTTMSKA